MKQNVFAAFGFLLVVSAAFGGSSYVRSVKSIEGGNPPEGYVPALVSNGSLTFGVDWRLGNCDLAYESFSTGIYREGVRHPDRSYELFDYGRMTSHIEVDGIVHDRPQTWGQTLDLREAKVGVSSEYPGAVSFSGELFVHSDSDAVVIRQCVSNASGQVKSLRLGVRYAVPVDERVSDAAWHPSENGASYRFRAHLLKVSNECIGLSGGAGAKFESRDGAGVLSESFSLEPGASRVCDWVVTFDGGKALKRDEYVKSHEAAWRRYTGESYVCLPDKRIQRMFEMANYHLRCVATKWSIPVGILPSQWSGKIFAFDELYACQALLAANHISTARIVPEYRFASCSNACNRTYHKFPLGEKWGAAWPWHGIENEFMEGSKPGFWQDHIFHMSAIARSVWSYYRYSQDDALLRDKIFHVMMCCANFFKSLHLYTDSNGDVFVGKCTDLERMGPGVERAFMTTCGIIDTFRMCADAADTLGVRREWAAELRVLAGKLERNLPVRDGRYIPYPGATVDSIGTLAGYFPFRIFDETDTAQRKAVEWFFENGRKVGNMYARGRQVCPWYAAWTAIAAQRAGMKDAPYRWMVEADRSGGVWGEFHEINEPVHPLGRPWFMTAAANCLYAICEMLLSEDKNGDPVIGFGVPDDWKDYSFKLAFPGNRVVEAAVKNGKIEKIDIQNADRSLSD